MSVTKRNGKWQVKYRVAGKQRYRTFDRKRDAETWEADFKRRRQLGPRLAVEHDRESMTLADYVAGPWRAHAATLAAPTRAKYAWALDKHLGELVDEPLIVIDAPMIAAQQRLLLDRGATASTVREVMAKLSGIMQIATEHGTIPSNPVRSVRNVPLGDDEHEITVLAPVELERVITGLTGRDRAIALLGGHLGLRPQEIRKVPWTALADGVLTIGRAQTKASARRSRVIAVPQLTARELREWQLQSGGRGDELIIGAMTPNALKLWARRHLPDGIRVTDLRHSHASACHYVRPLSLPAILKRLGHKQQVHFRHYAAAIDRIEETGGARYDSLDELIMSARATVSESGGRRMVTESQ